MLIVKELGIEIGPRRLLEPVSFVIGDGEKVGLVGRNGVGKSTLLQVLLGQHPEHVRLTGTVAHQGTLAHLPQEPIAGGLGVEPIGLSHVLSARGIDRSTPTMHDARHDLAARPKRRDDPSLHLARAGVPRAGRLRGRVRGRAPGRRAGS